MSYTVLLFATEQFAVPSAISGRSWLFLILSGFATGASWLCYFRALKLGPATLVAPIDKLSMVLVALFGVMFSANGHRRPGGPVSRWSPPAQF
jgi:transporter family protein